MTYDKLPTVSFYSQFYRHNTLELLKGVLSKSFLFLKLMHIKGWFESTNHDGLATGWPEESSAACPSTDLC